jgi:hypothetical protein
MPRKTDKQKKSEEKRERERIRRLQVQREEEERRLREGVVPRGRGRPRKHPEPTVPTPGSPRPTVPTPESLQATVPTPVLSETTVLPVSPRATVSPAQPESTVPPGSPVASLTPSQPITVGLVSPTHQSLLESTVPPAQIAPSPQKDVSSPHSRVTSGPVAAAPAAHPADATPFLPVEELGEGRLLFAEGLIEESHANIRNIIALQRSLTDGFNVPNTEHCLHANELDAYFMALTHLRRQPAAVIRTAFGTAAPDRGTSSTNHR